MAWVPTLQRHIERSAFVDLTLPKNTRVRSSDVLWKMERMGRTFSQIGWILEIRNFHLPHALLCISACGGSAWVGSAVGAAAVLVVALGQALLGREGTTCDLDELTIRATDGTPGFEVELLAFPNQGNNHGMVVLIG